MSLVTCAPSWTATSTKAAAGVPGRPFRATKANLLLAVRRGMQLFQHSCAVVHTSICQDEQHDQNPNESHDCTKCLQGAQLA